MENVSMDKLGGGLPGLGIQKGDLVYFYHDDGKPSHAAVVSKVDGNGVYHTANTNRRFDQDLGSALGHDSSYSGAYIVRIKDRITR